MKLFTLIEYALMPVSSVKSWPKKLRRLYLLTFPISIPLHVAYCLLVGLCIFGFVLWLSVAIWFLDIWEE
jgi:hypothetical protein